MPIFRQRPKLGPGCKRLPGSAVERPDGTLEFSSYTVQSTGNDPCPACQSLRYHHPQGTAREGWCPVCEQWVKAPDWRKGSDRIARESWRQSLNPPGPADGWGDSPQGKIARRLYEAGMVQVADEGRLGPALVPSELLRTGFFVFGEPEYGPSIFWGEPLGKEPSE